MPKRSSQPQRRNIHHEITQRIIEAIEANPARPQMPWRRAGGTLAAPKNARTNTFYSGINIVNLWVAAERRGFTTSLYATYKQWAELGAQVRRGEKSELIVFYKTLEVTPDPEREDDDGKRRIPRAYYVFNADQVDGYAPPAPPQPLPPLERNAAAERFIANTKIPIIHDGDQAFYHPATDTVTMPRPELFCGTDTLSREEGYYAVLAHECAHATGHHSRCDRDLSSRFGTAGYAKEELIAEISSAIICAELGITQDTRPDHAAYIANWLQILKDDDKAIFHAAARASEAVNWLNARQPQPLTDHRPKAEEGTHLQNPALEQAGANDPGPTLSDERIFA